MASIYKIENIVNNKVYIGKAYQVDKRFKNHLSKLETGKHYNTYLQREWNKYGKTNFTFIILENLNKNDLLLNKREIYWINQYNSLNKGYNMTLGGDGGKGRQHKKSSRLKMRKAKLGTKVPKRIKNKISKTLEGRTCSPEHRNNISKSQFKPVKQFTVSGQLIKEFPSVLDAIKLTGIKGISNVARGKRAQAGGFKWSYA